MSYQRTEYSSRNVNMLQSLIDNLEAYKVVGVIALEPMKGTAMQNIRRNLRESNNKMVISKNTLMRLAIEKSKRKEELSQLLPYIGGNCAFFFTNGNAIQVAKYLEESKVPAPARPGQIAPIDVVVPKMNTGVGPGTFIQELNSVGLPTRIEKGTIAISADTTVVKAGEVVSRALANLLVRLNITPFEVGLTLAAVVQNGILMDKDALLTDWSGMLAFAHQQAVNLAYKIEYVTDDTFQPLLAKAYKGALGLAAEISYVTEDNASDVIGIAQGKIMALIHAINAADPNALPEDLSAMAAPVAVATAEAPKEESQEEEEDEDEEVDEADMGLGSLFG